MANWRERLVCCVFANGPQEILVLFFGEFYKRHGSKKDAGNVCDYLKINVILMLNMNVNSIIVETNM